MYLSVALTTASNNKISVGVANGNKRKVWENESVEWIKVCASSTCSSATELSDAEQWI